MRDIYLTTQFIEKRPQIIPPDSPHNFIFLGIQAATFKRNAGMYVCWSLRNGSWILFLAQSLAILG